MEESNSKKFYWIKLQTDFFNQETIDFLLSQNNGSEYVVLYQMLCLKTANNNGCLSTNMGEIIIPYDIDKIVRDTKYFSEDTVRVALCLFKQLGLIYEQEDKILKISNIDNMVGSETKWAEKKRIYREKANKKKLGQKEDIVRQEIEYRDKSIDIDIDKDIIYTTTTTNNIYNYIESNFGRTLSPLEIEKIDNWLLSFKEEIIKYAVEISIMNNKKTFNYINGILNNWKSCGYKTIQEIKDNELPKKDENKEENKQTTKEEEILNYDWVNND